MSYCIVSSLLFHFFLSRFSNGLIGLCSDQSAFKDVFGVAGDGFRQYSAYATFVYSQLNSILPTSFLGDISNWNKFLSIDLTSADLPLKGPTEFLRDKDFANLVARAEIPTPTHFVEQAVCFYKHFCSLLLKHSIRKSKLIRGMSIFDESVIRHGEEANYRCECEQLCDYLSRYQWIPNSAKPLVLSEYCSFVEKFRSNDVSYDEDWVSFLSGFYELHCREHLHTVFKLCCLSSMDVSKLPPTFSFVLPELFSNLDDFESCVHTVQSSLSGIPNVTGLFNNPSTFAPIFSLLGRGKALLEDPDFSVWDVTSSCSGRRLRLFNRLDSRYTCTITEEERLWTCIDSVPKPVSTIVSPTVGKSGKFAKMSPFRAGPSTSVPTDQMPDLATATLSVPRVIGEIPFPPTETKFVKKISIKKKNSGGK